MNNLPNKSNKFDYVLFADAINLIYCDKSITDIITNKQCNLNKHILILKNMLNILIG